MAAGITYSVEVQYLSSGNLNAPQQSISKLQGSTDKWNNSLLRGVSSFATGFDSAVTSVGGAMLGVAESVVTTFAKVGAVGFGLAAKGAFNFNEEMENTIISLGAIANANGMVNGIEHGFREAGGIVAEMRKDARELPGEFKDLANIMTTITPAASGMGKNLQEIEKFAAKGMTAAAILQVPQQVAARELAALLEGRATTRMPLFTKLNLGMDSKSFNALEPDKRFEAANAALSKMDPALGRILVSWKTIKSTTIDSVRQGLGLVGAPVYESVKNLFKSLNSVSTGHEGLRNFGLFLGNEIDLAFKYGVQGIKHWFPIAKQFGETVFVGMQHAWAQVGPLMHEVVTSLENFMKDPKAFDKIESLAKTMLSLKVGSSAMGLAGEGAASLFGTFGPALLRSGVGVAELGLAATGAAAAVALIGAAFYGLTYELSDVNADLHDFAVSRLKDLSTNTADLGKNFHKSDELWGTLGVMGLDVLAADVGQLSLQFKILGGVVDAVRQAFDFTDWTKYDAPRYSDNEILHDIPTLAVAPVIPIWQDIAANIKTEKDKIPKHVTNIGHVTIQVNSNQDPFRVAKATRDIVADLARHPKIAALTGAPIYTR